jgi:hypothetical protein
MILTLVSAALGSLAYLYARRVRSM